MSAGDRDNTRVEVPTRQATENEALFAESEYRAVSQRTHPAGRLTASDRKAVLNCALFCATPTIFSNQFDCSCLDAQVVEDMTNSDAGWRSWRRLGCAEQAKHRKSGVAHISCQLPGSVWCDLRSHRVQSLRKCYLSVEHYWRMLRLHVV